MMHSPFLTVGIPAFNNIDTLLQALDSIKAQEFKDLEILISDDCSSVDLESQVYNWQSLNPEIVVRYFYQKKNLHIPANKRWLLENANGLFFAFLEHDDYLIDTDFYLNIFTLYEKKQNIKAFIGNAYLDSPAGSELFFKGKIHENSQENGFQVLHSRKLLKKLNSSLSLEPFSINWSSLVVNRQSTLDVDAFSYTYLTNPEFASKIQAFPHEENMAFLTLLHDQHPIAYTSRAVSHRKVSETSFSINFEKFTENTDYPNDIAFFNFFRAASLATTFVTKYYLYKRAIFTGVVNVTPEIQRYIVKRSYQNLFVGLAWFVGNFLNRLLHPLIKVLRRIRRLVFLITTKPRYLKSRIAKKFWMFFAPFKR